MCLPSNGPAGWTGMASFPCLVIAEMPPGTIGATNNLQSSQASVGLITRENRSMKGLLRPRHNIVQSKALVQPIFKKQGNRQSHIAKTMDTGKGREWNHFVISLPHITPDKSTLVHLRCGGEENKIYKG